MKNGVGLIKEANTKVGVANLVVVGEVYLGCDHLTISIHDCPHA